MALKLGNLIVLDPEHLDTFCREDFEKEACGVLLGRKKHIYWLVTGALILPNRATTPSSHFALHRGDIPTTLLSQVLCPVHVHPPQFGVEPSESDLGGLTTAFGVVLAPLYDDEWQASLYTAKRTIATMKWK